MQPHEVSYITYDTAAVLKKIQGNSHRQMPQVRLVSERHNSFQTSSKENALRCLKYGIPSSYLVIRYFGSQKRNDLREAQGSQSALEALGLHHFVASKCLLFWDLLRWSDTPHSASQCLIGHEAARNGSRHY